MPQRGAAALPRRDVRRGAPVAVVHLHSRRGSPARGGAGDATRSAPRRLDSVVRLPRRQSVEPRRSQGRAPRDGGAVSGLPHRAPAADLGASLVSAGPAPGPPNFVPPRAGAPALPPFIPRGSRTVGGPPRRAHHARDA